jgi:hypothetical protein
MTCLGTKVISQLGQKHSVEPCIPWETVSLLWATADTVFHPWCSFSSRQIEWSPTAVHPPVTCFSWAKNGSKPCADFTSALWTFAAIEDPSCMHLKLFQSCDERNLHAITIHHINKHLQTLDNCQNNYS